MIRPSTRPRLRRMRHVIGWSYRSLGLFEKADPHLSAPAAIRRRELEPSQPDTLKSMDSLGVLLEDKGEFVGADGTGRQAYDIYRRVLGNEHAHTVEAM